MGMNFPPSPGGGMMAAPPEDPTADQDPTEPAELIRHAIATITTSMSPTPELQRAVDLMMKAFEMLNGGQQAPPPGAPPAMEQPPPPGVMR
jgi:hypothetical protein